MFHNQRCLGTPYRKSWNGCKSVWIINDYSLFRTQVVENYYLMKIIFEYRTGVIQKQSLISYIKTGKGTNPLINKYATIRIIYNCDYKIKVNCN